MLAVLAAVIQKTKAITGYGLLKGKNMRLNRWLWLMLLVILAAGCETNYHGPEYMDRSTRLPPSFWDNSGNTSEMGVPGQDCFTRRADNVMPTKLS
jgi:hypothetical protein